MSFCVREIFILTVNPCCISFGSLFCFTIFSLDSASNALVLLSWCSKITKMCVPESAVVKILSEVEVICYSIVCAFHNNRMKRLQKCAYHYLETGKVRELQNCNANVS